MIERPRWSRCSGSLWLKQTMFRAAPLLFSACGWLASKEVCDGMRRFHKSISTRLRLYVVAQDSERGTEKRRLHEEPCRTNVLAACVSSARMNRV